MNIATYLTLSRIVISPIFLILYIYYGSFGIGSMAIPYILLVLLALCELSDAFDGHFARKYGQVTDLGKVLDPMADSIFRISVFLAFTQPPVSLPLVWVFVLIYRDSVVSILRTLCALNGYALAARISGKLKAIFQAIAALLILLLMIPQSVGVLSTERLQFISSWIIGVVAIYTSFSGMEYIADNWGYIRETFQSASKNSSHHHIDFFEKIVLFLFLSLILHLMFDSIFLYLDQLDDVLWSFLGIPILVSLGLLFTFRSRFLQIRGLLPSFQIFKNFFSKKNLSSDKGIHPLQVFFASVGGCVGIGNIVGICIGVQLGGPGALFWVWVTAMLGMILKYMEVYLGMQYRQTNKEGGYDGGPMYYLQKAFRSRWIPSLVCVLLGIYGIEVFQFSVVAHSVSANLGINYFLVVIALLALVVYAGIGGIRRVGAISSTIIPVFVFVYLGMGLWVLLMNVGAIPGVLREIFVYAFQPHAAIGGFVGSSLMYTISQGVRRGCYTADVGIGYASIIHAESQETSPEKQASLTFVGVVIDTFLVCTNSILLVLITDVWHQPIDASLMVQKALSQYFPYMHLFMPFFLLLLGYSTINAYFVVGIKCAQFLSPRYGRKAYIAYAVAILFLFSFGGAEQALTAMSIPAVLLLLVNAAGFIILRKNVDFLLPLAGLTAKRAKNQ